MPVRNIKSQVKYVLAVRNPFLAEGTVGAETGIVKDLLVYGSELGARLFRNNSGSLPDLNGRWVTFGVGNPPGGGSDLIGLTPVVITQDMVGKTIGVFTAAEIKTVKGKKADEQLAFIETIRRLGGKAGFARNREELQSLIRGTIG